MRFQALSNKAAGVGVARSRGSCESRVGFYPLLQAVSMDFFFGF